MSTAFCTIKQTLLTMLIVATFLSSGIIAAQAPTQKIDSLNNQASALLEEDVAASIDYAYDALAINRKGLYLEGLNRSYLHLGIAYTRTQVYDSAITYLRNAESYFSSGKELGLVKYFLGVTYCDLTGFETARQFFLEAQDIFEQIDQEEHRADVLRALGYVELKLDNKQRALNYLQEALKVKQQAGLSTVAEFELLSQWFRHLGEFSKATEYAKQGVIEAQKQGSVREVIESYNQLAASFLAEGQIDSAILSYESAIRLPGSIQQAEGLKSVLKLSELYQGGHDYNQAIQLISEILDELNNRLDSPNRTSALLLQARLVEVYFSAGKRALTISYGIKLLEELRSKGYIQESIQIAEIVARAAKQAGDYSLSIEFYERMAALQKQLLDSLNIPGQLDWSSRIKLLDLSNELSLTSRKEVVSLLQREKMVLLILLGLGLGLILLLILLLWYRNQMIKGQQEKNGIKKTMQQAQEDLYKQTLHMMHMNNCLNEVEEQVRLLMAAQPDQKLSKILKSIRLNKSMDRDWDNFNTYFGNVNVGFYEKISEYSDKLSNHDRRVCALIKLNLTNREIATILNIEVKSVSMIKYRIKKKLGLDDAVELSHFITQV